MTDDILAAGAVLHRTRAAGEALPPDRRPPTRSASRATAVVGDGVELCLVHRPKYDDWSLPKGKLDDGESMAAAAVREIHEETGVRARLGPWLRDVRYMFGDARKMVRYWSAEARSADGFTPNHEVDELRWVSPDVAKSMLSYPHDADVVERFVELGVPTSVLLLVRHAKAGNRVDWEGDDVERPLTTAGAAQAEAIAELLPHFGPDRIATAPLVRCRATVEPLAAASGLAVTEEPLLTEAAYGADPGAVLSRLRELAAVPGVTVLSSQGGVIPGAVAALARDAAVAVAVDPDDVPSKKGSAWVLALRDGALVAADYVKKPGR